MKNGGKVGMQEVNNQKQGRSGAATSQVMGPAVGRTSGNVTKGGGINRATKGVAQKGQ